ncbi:MAG: hypothetical protein NTV22_10260 [bacterium]|nr:hypothetical protein [bacterium]
MWPSIVSRITVFAWFVSTLAVAAVAVSCRAAATATVQGAALSIASAPFQDTWDAMRARDRAQHEVAAVNRVAPLGVPEMNAIEPAARAAADHAVYATPGRRAPQATGTLFNARNDTGWLPPDTMGAIGPNHFMEVINGNVTIYSRTGTQLSDVTLASFFTVTIGGVTYPRGGAFDPRVLYDRRSGRWFATAMEFGANTISNDVILAVCRTSDPTSGIWDKYLLPMHVDSSGGINYFTDHSTIGMDDNGVYFGTRIFPTAGLNYAKILATAKAPLIAPAPSITTIYQWTGISDMYSTPQPAHNHDAVAPDARAWIVAASASVYANIQYRRVTWSGGVPTLDGVSSTLTTPSFGVQPDAPASGSTTAVDTGDMRLQNTVIRNNRLWTCRCIGVNSSGGATSADRAAAEWLELNVATATPTLVQSGRIYDPAASDPRFYYYPSVMVNGQGHAVLGCSGSKSTEFIGCYTCGRLATDVAGTMGAVLLFKAGLAAYTKLDTISRNRWGDYSATTLDPNDDMSMWTIQEYANTPANTWRTYVAKMLSPAPTLVDPATNAPQSATAFALALTGTGFYDPGAGYTNRLVVVLTGGSPNGISNYNVVYLTPSNVTATFDISGAASPGGRTIVLTNPDGQSANVASGLVVVPEPAAGMGLMVFAVIFFAAKKNMV